MKEIIIFDFNRTLYDPDADKLISGAKFVLRILCRRGFSLYLISRAGKSRRALIRSLGIEHYFSRVIVAKEKSKKDFKRIVASKTVDRHSSFVVGDRVRKEIRIGNELGLQTIWLCAGKFAGERPVKKIEQPIHTARSLRDVLRIIRR